jgi:hypothetical protein
MELRLLSDSNPGDQTIGTAATFEAARSDFSGEAH